MVLVCVTAFKGRHKIKSMWENREYVVEWQPYPNLPVYVVHSIDGKGHSHTLHRNLLLISSNLEQRECANSVGGDGSRYEATLVPYSSDAFPVHCLARNQQESALNLPSNQINQSFWRWADQPALTPQREGPKMTLMHQSHYGVAIDKQETNSPKGTKILHFSRIISFQVPLTFVLTSLSASI